MAKSLEAAGVSAASIHGDKTQSQRERALAAFKAGETRALVATDIAARGIDIDAVSHVVNFELPHVAESYVHRIGRTARAGAGGEAISLCADDERPLVRDIQKLTRQTIPAEDRRRDPGLAVMAKARAVQEAEQASKNGGQGRDRDPRARLAPEQRKDGPRTGQPHRSRGRGKPGGGGGGGRAPARAGGGSAGEARPTRQWHPLEG